MGEDKVQPGDIIKIHGGLYQGVLLNYPDWHNIPFDGTYWFTAKGTAERPIVIEAAGDGEVIFDGQGAANLFNVMATDHHIFQGLTFRNVDRVFEAGRKHLAGASNLTVRNCRFENVGEGLRTEYAGSKNFLIQDNVIIGRDDRYRLFGWAAHREGFIPYGTHLLDSYYGIKVYGSGHVIAHNSIAFFHDSIGISTYGTPEEEQELKAVSIDIYNNDLHLQVDDFVEADGGVHNIRVMRNRGVNAAENGISAQPVFGGPAYYIRNVLYNVPLGGALKIHGGVPGLTAYHNTFITENNTGARYPNSNFRNNLFLGTDGPTVVSSLHFTTPYSVADFNGYRPNRGPDSPENQFRWLTPEGKGAEFRTLESFSKASGLEENGITVDYDVFEDLQKPIHALERGLPSPVYHAVDLNFKLNPDGKAVDAGVVIPNVNDNFNGQAPDLGALEVGAPPVGLRCARPRSESGVLPLIKLRGPEGVRPRFSTWGHVKNQGTDPFLDHDQDRAFGAFAPLGPPCHAGALAKEDEFSVVNNLRDMTLASLLKVMDEGIPVFGIEQALKFHFGSRSIGFRGTEKRLQILRIPTTAASAFLEGVGEVESDSRPNGSIEHAIESRSDHIRSMLSLLSVAAGTKNGKLRSPLVEG